MSPTKETASLECTLLRLPDESLSDILMACDPEDALRMEQTCKILHLLSDSKHLWLNLLAKLDYDQAPDVGPHVDLGSLEAKEVKKIVVRALTSYNNRCCPDRTTRKQKIQLEVHQLVAVMVLPGCQYLIVQSRNSNYFGVWDMNGETLVARYQYNRKLQFIAHDCALLKGGKIARFAFLRVGSPDHIEVVDFDLHHGHATLLSSESVPDTTNVPCLKVREEAVLLRCNFDIAVLSPETGKLAMVAVECYKNDFDIARGSLICVSTAFYGSVHLYVAKLSRIFEHIEGTESIPLEDICEICRALTFIRPTLLHRRHTTLTICDPLNWGSARSCRILLANIDNHSYEYNGNRTVRVHRFYLEGSHNGSDLALTYDSSSNPIPLEESSDRRLTLTQSSIPGRWLLPSRSGKGKYDIMVHRLWDDDVRLFHLDRGFYVRVEAERFSGTEIWYLDDGNCILHFYEELGNI